ncbi:DUF3592 domain-containing protein [Vibrio sp.]|uniref:DUF3592 domain-containing protein n=1 Tax=Vibrio sp. TaxID=678 RepID=UPI003AA99999
MKIVSNLIVIAVLLLFSYAIISILIRDSKNKKDKELIVRDGISTSAIITEAISRSGGNSGFINVDLHFKFYVANGDEVRSKSSVVIKSMDVVKYQPGEAVQIRYSEKEPGKVILDIPNPLIKKNN